MAETYRLISFIAFIFASIFAILSLGLFFKFNIRKIFGDLTGRNERKAVEAMRKRMVEKDDTSSNLSLNKKDEEATVILPKTAIAGSVDEEAATELLNKDLDATLLLEKDNVDSEQTVLLEKKSISSKAEFIVETEITFIHTDIVL